MCAIAKSFWLLANALGFSIIDSNIAYKVRHFPEMPVVIITYYPYRNTYII